MMPGHWLGSVLCVPFTLMVGWQKGHCAHKIPIPPITRVSWTLTFPFSTNMAISEIKAQGWRAEGSEKRPAIY